MVDTTAAATLAGTPAAAGTGSGAATPAAQGGAPPAQLATAAKGRKGKGKKKGPEDAPLGALVMEDVEPFIRARELVVPVDALRLDLRVEHGQIRGLKQEDVAALATAMARNPPTSRVHVTLWEYDLDADGNGVTL